jgi:hypothetical protein
VDAVEPEAGKKVDVVLLSGGANDIGFDTVINPQEFPGAFIEEFDGKIRAIAHEAMLALIGRVRTKCPNAVIMVFGYYAPLSYRSSSERIRAFFKHENGDNFGWWVNGVFNFVDVDRMVLESKVRAVWAQGRAQHWTRRSVAEANRNATLRGPGVIFVPSGMRPEHSVFAPAPRIHEDFTHQTTDSAQSEREAGCPRIQHLDDMRRAALALLPVPFGSPPPRSAFTSLRDAVAQEGPAPLADALTAFIDRGERAAASRLLNGEISRIQRALIASFFHPNPDGARGYAQLAMERYRRHRKLTAVITKAERPGQNAAAATSPGESLDDKLKRYGVRTDGSLHADAGQLDVDALSLFVVTARESDRLLTPDVTLVIETRASDGSAGRREYALNFPYRILVLPVPGSASVIVVKKFYPHFEPAETNRFTIDTGGELRLDEIVGCSIVLGPDKFAGQNLSGPHGSVWRPRRIELQINGQSVVDLTFRTKEVRPDGALSLDYPPTAPRPQAAGQTAVAGRL